MSKARELIICESCGKSEWHDHCIVCDKDLGEYNSHHAIEVSTRRYNMHNSEKREYVCSIEHLREYVNGLTEDDFKEG